MLLCLLVGSVSAVAADNPFCLNLAQFAQDLKGSEEREVTVFSEWSAEPTKACRHDPSDPRSVRFCEWILEHTSTEFMEVNVGNALACLAGNRWRGIEGTVEFLTGKVHFHEHKLRGAKNVVFEVEYSVRHGHDTDMLRIAVSPLDAK